MLLRLLFWSRFGGKVRHELWLRVFATLTNPRNRCYNVNKWMNKSSYYKKIICFNGAGLGIININIYKIMYDILWNYA